MQEFGSWTAICRDGDWLKACGIRTVAMQSTGCIGSAVQEYWNKRGWRCIWSMRGDENLPGRKSDVQECQWLMKLHTYGLLAEFFPATGRDSRGAHDSGGSGTGWCRMRDERSSRSKKALTTMNIRCNAISDVSGVTGLAILRAF